LGEHQYAFGKALADGETHNRSRMIIRKAAAMRWDNAQFFAGFQGEQSIVRLTGAMSNLYIC
jgi:hypothetical protein